MMHWHIDYTDPNLEGLLREVLGHYFQMVIWHKAKACDLGETPDLTEIGSFIKQAKATCNHRHLSWVDAVAQGGADTSFSRCAVFEEGLVKCSRCAEIVEGDIWQHLSYFCRDTLEDASLEDFETVARAQAELALGIRPALCLRGLRPLDMLDPLDTDYDFTNSWGSGLLDIEGYILGSDGTGGEFARHARLRRCCFGAAVIHVGAHHVNTIGTAYGTVCGKQTVPRSETQGLLHMLKCTKGNATIVIDNKHVVDTFKKGLRARPKFNGVLWSANFKAARDRIAHGFGILRPVWINSHVSFDVAISQGIDP